MIWPHELVATAVRVIPGVACRVSDTDAVVPPWHGCRSDDLVALFQRLRADHPEAGWPYAAMRGWDLLTWQPVYLGVIAVHLHLTPLDLGRLSLTIEDGVVKGCALPAHVPVAADETAGLEAVAAQLLSGIERLLPRWQEQSPLHPKAALWACVDGVMDALRAVKAYRSDWTLHDLREHGQRWLRALGVGGDSGFVRCTVLSGEALTRVRRVCCLHCRRRDAQCCTNCPRLTAAQRAERLRRA